jgi:hypothetical protein
VTAQWRPLLSDPHARPDAARSAELSCPHCSQREVVSLETPGFMPKSVLDDFARRHRRCRPATKEGLFDFGAPPRGGGYD